MVGLEKVTNKIIASAEAEATEILARADEECAAILGDAEARAHEIRVAAEDAADAEGEGVVSRARAAAATERRGIMLGARCHAIDSVFEAAERKICGMPSENYLGFLVALSREAARGQTGDCRLTLGRSDRVSFGRALVEQLERELPDIKWQLADGDPRIGGGLWLDFGETRIDCTVSALITEARGRLEREVCRILFGGRGDSGND